MSAVTEYMTRAARSWFGERTLPSQVLHRSRLFEREGSGFSAGVAHGWRGEEVPGCGRLHRP